MQLLHLDVTTPSGEPLSSVGVAPGVALFYEGGRWAARFLNEVGCDRYRVGFVIP